MIHLISTMFYTEDLLAEIHKTFETYIQVEFPPEKHEVVYIPDYSREAFCKEVAEVITKAVITYLKK